MGLLQSEFFEQYATTNMLILLDPRLCEDDKKASLQQPRYGKVNVPNPAGVTIGAIIFAAMLPVVITATPNT